jgi:hypothetical protein
MPKKTKTPQPRKAKPKAKAVKPPRRAAAPRKKIVRRKKARKPVSTLRRIENALLVGVAEADEVALSLGLLGATQPPRKSRKKGHK